MKKRLLTIAAVSAVALSSVAASPSKLSLDARQAVDELNYRALKGEMTAYSEADASPVGVTFKLKPGVSADDLNVRGLNVVTTIGRIVVADIPLTRLDELASLDEVVSVELSRESQPDLLFARMGGTTAVSKVHTDPLGELGRVYLGAGTVVGLMDSGLDPNHINFRTGPNYSETRVKKILRFADSSTTPAEELTTPEDIMAFTTEAEGKNHGTHVLGIMAGGYSGPGKWHDYDFGTPDSLQTEEMGSSTKTNYPDLNASGNKPIPYYGMAPRAEIVVGCGPLYANAQLVTAQKTIEYAKSVGKPCVVNYSLGSQMGPKDGSGTFAEAMAELGQKAIICWSASNDGEKNAYLSQILKAKPSFKTTVMPLKDGGADGKFEFWAIDEKPLKVRFFVYDYDEYDEYDLKTIDGATNGTVVLTSDMIADADMKSIFSGSVKVTSAVMSQNNRFQVYVTLSKDFKMKAMSSGITPRLAVEVTGYAGQRVDANATSDILAFSNAGDTDFVNGSNIMCINNSATIHNNFAVGSYVPRDRQIRVKADGTAGSRFYAGWEMPLDIAESSGFATLIDGRKLPHTAAPGTDIVSSNSRYIPDPTDQMNAFVDFGGQRYYWRMMSGTSMSCPAFSGICALWLEADPTLSFSDINKVLKKTCYKDKWVDARPERFGAGKVNAYEGMKYVLANKTDGISVAEIDNDKILVSRIADNTFEVTVGMGETFTVSLVSLSGTAVASATGTDSVALDASDVNKGIYVLTVNSGKVHHAVKVVVR